MSPEARAAKAATMRRYRARRRGELPPWVPPAPIARDPVAWMVPVTNEDGSICLEWTRATNRDGYAVMRWRGRVRIVSRVVLELALGRSLAPGMKACHTCDNRPCCYRGHLFEGTHEDNMADMASKGRGHWQRAADPRSPTEQAADRSYRR